MSILNVHFYPRSLPVKFFYKNGQSQSNRAFFGPNEHGILSNRFYRNSPRGIERFQAVSSGETFFKYRTGSSNLKYESRSCLVRVAAH